MQKSLEKQINMLKGMTLLQQIGDQHVTPELVLRANEHLNENCRNALCKMGNVVQLFSPDHKLTKYSDKQHYCEDEHLSLGPPGMDLLALAVDRDSVCQHRPRKKCRIGSTGALPSMTLQSMM